MPDPDALYASFADGLRAAFGKLPVAGIPRIVRPRKRFGTVYGFSVVDVGGNWLRISRIGDTEEAADHADAGLAKVLEVAARLGDSHGDDAAALKALEMARCRATLMLPPSSGRGHSCSEPSWRCGWANALLAQSSLSEALAMAVGDAERALIARELDHASDLVAGMA